VLKGGKKEVPEKSDFKKNRLILGKGIKSGEKSRRGDVILKKGKKSYESEGEGAPKRRKK